jgi:hypothetical protein
MLRITRRDLIKTAGAGLLLASCGGESGFDLMLEDGASFDEVLDKLHATDPVYGGGLANHGPMAAEALVTLGHPDRVVDFVSRYDSRLSNLPQEAPLPAEDRAAALGAIGRRAEWIASYEAELVVGSPTEVLRRDWPTLCSGYASIHGVLRTAHAIRSLDRMDSESRRRELAHGLGYWSADYVTLIGEPGANAIQGKGVVQSLADIQLVPDERRISEGTINDALATAEHSVDFAKVVESLDVELMPIETAITELTAAASRLFVDQGGTGFSLRRIAYLHAITGASALRLFLPFLDLSSQRLGLGHAFQFVAAVHAAFGSSKGVPPSVPPSLRDVTTLAAAAARHDDEHVIKLGEVATREYGIDPRPEFLAASDAWLS